MYFLKVSDYSKQIKQDNLALIIENDSTIRLDAERAAESEINMYLSNNYDTSKVFAPMLAYSNSNAYAIGDRVYSNEVAYSSSIAYTAGALVSYAGNIYKNILASTNVVPTNTTNWTLQYKNDTVYYASAVSTGNLPSDIAFWTEGDNRNALLVMIYVDIVLYHLHSRINPRNIPQLRLDRCDEAKKMLIGVAGGELFLDLPTYPIVDEDLEPIHWGSNKKLKHEY